MLFLIVCNIYFNDGDDNIQITLLYILQHYRDIEIIIYFISTFHIENM